MKFFSLFKRFLVSLSVISLISLSLLVFFDIISINAQPMRTYQVKQGGHFSSPRLFAFKRGPQKITWEVIMGDDCNYIIKDGEQVSVDQLDWNKLCGAYFNLFSTLHNTAMIAWRYSIENDLIELSPYYHVEGSRDMFPPMMTVKRQEPFTVILKVDWENKKYIWEMKKAGSEVTHEMPFQHQHKLCGFINFYFGGNRTAPQQVSCQMSRSIE